MKRPEGFYGSLLLTLSGALVAAGLALAVLMLSATIGPFHFLGARDASGTGAVGLWVPASAFSVAAPERARRLRAWRTATGRLREVRTIRSLDPEATRVIALPDARALSEPEATVLRSYVAAGGGAILTGAVGVRDRDGRWRSWDLMERLLGGATVVPVAAGSSRFLLADARGPLTAGLAPRHRVPLHAEPGAPALELPEAELRWADADGPTPLAASRRLGWGRGRLVWLGAGPERADEKTAEQLFVGDDMTRLLDAAIAWVGREPYVEMLPWPGRAPLGAWVEGGDGADGLEPAALARTATAGERRRLIDAEIADAVRSARLFRLALPADFASEAERGALVEYARTRLHAKQAWFAGRGEIARWRRLHSGLAVSIERVGPNRHLLGVANHNREAVTGAVLRVHVNDAVRDVHVDRTTLQQDAPVVSVRFETGTVDLLLPDLAGGANHTYTLDVERTHPGAPSV